MVNVRSVWARQTSRQRNVFVFGGDRRINPSGRLTYAHRITYADRPTTTMSATPTAEAGVLLHVDPKAYFSAERTFIQWMHIALTVGSIALSLSTLADSDDVRTAGALLIAPSLCFLVYGLVSYYRRRAALDRAALDALDDRLGPAALMLVMVAVVGANVLFALRRAWAHSVEDDGEDAFDPYAT